MEILNIVVDKEKMFGRPAKYIATKPEQILFVNETGSNTNQKEDGYAGSQRYILPNDGTNVGVIGDTTDIRFTTLCFTIGACAPVKSEKEIDKLPLNVKLGVDILKNIWTRETNTTLQILQDNTNEEGGLCGGPVCHYNGVEVPCFVCCTKKQVSHRSC
jgi:hypothetical protein